MIRKILACGTILVSLNVKASGIPVFDASTFAQVVAQLQQTQQLLLNANKQLEAITGNSNIGRMLFESALSSYIPTSGDWSEIFELDLAPLLEQYGLSSENEAIQATYEKEVAVMVAAERSYQAQTQRLANIEALMDRANEVNNPQQREDLANAISIEKAAIQLEQNRMIALQQTIEQDRRLREEVAIKNLHDFFGLNKND